MAAPATTARGNPAGITLKDGYSTKLAFALLPTYSFWEKTLTPPTVDGRDAIDITTMHNDVWTTLFPRSLIALNEFTMTGSWDPNVYNHVIDTLINTNGSITVHLPDGSTIDFWGYLRIWAPDNHEEGTQPDGTITVTPTNWDDDNNVEAAPVITSVAGT